MFLKGDALLATDMPPGTEPSTARLSSCVEAGQFYLHVHTCVCKVTGLCSVATPRETRVLLHCNHTQRGGLADSSNQVSKVESMISFQTLSNWFLPDDFPFADGTPTVCGSNDW